MRKNPLSSEELSDLLGDMQEMLEKGEKALAAGNNKLVREWAWRLSQLAASVRPLMDRSMPQEWQDRYNQKLMHYMKEASKLRDRVGTGYYKKNPPPPPFKYVPGERVKTGIASGLRSGQEGIITRAWWDGPLGTNMYEVSMISDGKYLTYWESDILSATKSIPMKFKVGDRVKVINKQSGHFGRVGKVVNFFFDNTMPAPEYDVVLDGQSVDIAFRESSLGPEDQGMIFSPPKKPKVDAQGYMQQFVVGDIVKVRTEMATSTSGYIEAPVAKTGYDALGGYFTVTLMYKGKPMVYPEKHVAMVKKTRFFDNPADKRLYLRELEAYDMQHGESEVRALEMMIDAGDHGQGVPIQFWQDVKTYGLAEAFVYLKGYAEQGYWKGNLDEVKAQVNKMLQQNGRIRRFQNNPWLLAGPQIGVMDDDKIQGFMGGGGPAQKGDASPVTAKGGGSLPSGEKTYLLEHKGGVKVKSGGSRKPVGPEERQSRHRRAVRQRRDDKSGKFYDNPNYEQFRPNPYAYRVWNHADGKFSDHWWYKTKDSAEDHQRQLYLDSIKDQIDQARQSGDSAHLQAMKDAYSRPEEWTEFYEAEIRPVWVDSKKWNQIPWTKVYQKNPWYLTYHSGVVKGGAEGKPPPSWTIQEQAERAADFMNRMYKMAKWPGQFEARYTDDVEAVYGGDSIDASGKVIRRGLSHNDNPRADDDEGAPDEGFGWCEVCSGPLVPLGSLGNRIHFRCRNCGAQSSRERREDDPQITFENNDPYWAVGWERTDGERGGYFRHHKPTSSELRRLADHHVSWAGEPARVATAKVFQQNPGFMKVAEERRGDTSTTIYIKYDKHRRLLTARYVEDVGSNKKGLEVEVAAHPMEAKRIWHFVKQHGLGGFSAFLKAMKRAGRAVNSKRAYEEAR